MRRALIGFGTPLGSYLAQRRTFSDCYTYKQALNGIGRCDEAVVIAPADRRLGGNRLAPQGHALVAALKQSSARIVLLSSIDVYSSKGVPFDETAEASGLPGKAWLPLFEQAILACGIQAAVLRLPEVFGVATLRGSLGCVFDGDASKINRVAIHQWYPAYRLERDIATAQALSEPIVNLVSEPLPMAAILKQFFPGQIGKVVTPAPYSRIRTLFAGQFGGIGAYIMSAGEILEEVGRHLKANRIPGSRRAARLPAFVPQPMLATVVSG
jgi:hypothetical protein